MGDRGPWHCGGVRPACPAQPQLQSAPSGSICARIRSDGSDRGAGQPGSAEGSADGAPRPLTCCTCCLAWGSSPSSWLRVSAACGAMPAGPVRVCVVLGTALGAAPGITHGQRVRAHTPGASLGPRCCRSIPAWRGRKPPLSPGTPTVQAAGNVGVHQHCQERQRCLQWPLQQHRGQLGHGPQPRHGFSVWLASAHTASWGSDW